VKPLVIAILEDSLDRKEAMQEWLADRYSAYEAYFTDDPATLNSYLDLNQNRILAVSLDHDLNDRADGNLDVCGLDVARHLSEQSPAFPVVIHTTNTSQGDRMEKVLRKSGWAVSRVVPFDGVSWIGTDWHRALKRSIEANAPRIDVDPAIDEDEVDENNEDHDSKFDMHAMATS